MNRGVKFLLITIAMVSLSAGVQAQDKSGPTLDQLLQQVKQGLREQSAEDKRRIQEFMKDKAKQQQMLEQAKKERAALEAKSTTMEHEFDANETKIGDLNDTLNKRLGSLKELFGVLQQSAQDARGNFQDSLTNIQYPARIQFLEDLAKKMGQTSKLASIGEIERLWYELQREMTASGKVVRVPATVIKADGNEVKENVIRVGLFNVIADGKYLQYQSDTGKLLELPRQPASRFLETAEALTKAKSGKVKFGIDPTRGQLLGLLIQEPTLRERINQGGTIGYITIALGIFGFIIAILRLIQLTFVGIKVAAQKRNRSKPNTNNPLGRVLQVYYDNTSIDMESLELKLGEAVLKETPKLSRFNTLLKVIAVVAPLLGLLGTVTGMIITFQAITLFGTGDPKLMAGGISQALVTTVLGLCVAIPTVLLHTLVSGRSRRIIEVLEEQATGMVAEYAEKQGKKSTA
ncbi:MAG: MotA/TolQ/ExbB proton channel family protein [Gammaproteobacteria bacterium]|jgi:biopolymer transport protein ExbB